MSGFWSTAATFTGRLGGADSASPAVQTFSVPSVVAGTTNTPAVDTVFAGSQGTGTGAAGAFRFQIAPAGSSGSAQNALVDFMSIGRTASPGPADRAFGLMSSAGSSAHFWLTNNVYGVSAGSQWTLNIGTGALGYFTSSGIVTIQTFGFASGANAAADVLLYRDAAATLALRNGATAQSQRIYRTYTDASNYQRINITWNTTTALLMNEGLGTGADGSVAFNDAALATNATKGFVMIPSCAGIPTGVPADIPSGQIPMVYDSTNNKLYVYNGGWKASGVFA